MTTNNSTHHCTVSIDLTNAKWGWACRNLSRSASYRLTATTGGREGDVVVAVVKTIRNHSRIMTADQGRARMYTDDVIVGVLGNRYATDAFEAYGRIENGAVDMLTNAGMLGSVLQRNPAVRAPTQLEVVGILADADGRAINLIERGFRPRSPATLPKRVVLMVGTGMNAGKTTSATKLVRGLMAEGHKVGALKVTGSVSPNDRGELAATGAPYVRDFSDYGFPSTFLESIARVKQLFMTMVADAFEAGVDTVVVELADGVLQRETEALIADPKVQACCVGAILAAPCALSALMGIESIRVAGLPVLGVTGIINNAPLFVRELSARSSVPVWSSVDDGSALGQGAAAALSEVSSCAASPAALAA